MEAPIIVKIGTSFGLLDNAAVQPDYLQREFPRRP
jgi:hypothetical protein